tara:strand:+ start:4324 stop:4710 length:387 start_codon:yes stop_codon:yes gene_type:complete
MIYLLLSATLASELPDKPKPSDPVVGQCERAISVLPEFISSCKGVLLPTSWMADYERLSVWADQVAAHHRLDTKMYDLKIAALEKELEIAKKPVPFWERPIVWSTLGIAMGGAIVVAGGYAVGVAGGK